MRSDSHLPECREGDEAASRFDETMRVLMAGVRTACRYTLPGSDVTIPAVPIAEHSAKRKFVIGNNSGEEGEFEPEATPKNLGIATGTS